MVACAESRAVPSFATRDSAGVEIVENADAAWGTESEWSVAAAPALDLGVAAGQPEYEFVTILGLTRLSNGNIVVANRGTRELRFFSPAGEFIHAVGREGEGPGEFRNFNGAYRYGEDSLLVWDYRLFRWSVFDTAGAFGRIIQPSRPLMNPRALAPLDDGTLLLADTWIDDVERRTIDHQRIIRFARDGGGADSLGAFRARETFRSNDGAPVSMGRIFGATLVRAATDDGFLVGSGEEYEVLDHDASGVLRRRIRWDGEDRTVVAADVDAYRMRFRERWTGDDETSRAFLRLLAEVPSAEQFPAYADLIVDTDGNLWLAAYPRPSREGPRLWTVIDSTGRWLGEVALPAGLEVWEIGADYVLGVFDDELGVEHVRKYRLIKE
jgi:hypothetical protein